VSDGVTTERLVMLRHRWESDPTSRIFLQLAEEHRHLGQVQEALGVLDRGLQEHPGYLSALVAKGRCHLELGEPEVAKPVLERVVKQDATQMVANKLLVRAYLETGEADRARERLDLYRLLNDSDPEIEVLRRRIQQLDRPPEPAAAVSTPVFAPTVTAPIPVFSEPPRSTGPAPPSGGADVEVLEPHPVTPETPPVQRSEANPFSLPSEPPPVRIPGSFDEVFPGLHLETARDRYLVALSAEGIFPLAAAVAEPLTEERPAAEPALPPEPDLVVLPLPLPAAGPTPWSAASEPFDLAASPLPQLRFEPEPVFAPVPPPADTYGFAEPYLEPEPDFDLPAEPETVFPPAAAHDLAGEPEPVFDLAPEPAFAPWPEPVPDLPPEPLPLPSAADSEAGDDDTVSELLPIPAAVPAPQAPFATVTLAELYVHQGYPAEAERIYREVLEREPGSAAALSGLDRLSHMERRQRPLLARDLLVDYQEEGASAGAETSRARHMLQAYLQRLRERSPSDVS